MSGMALTKDNGTLARTEQGRGTAMVTYIFYYTFKRTDAKSDGQTADEALPECVVQNVSAWETVFATPPEIALVMAHDRLNRLGLVRNHLRHLLVLPKLLSNVVVTVSDRLVHLSRRPDRPHHWLISSKEISLVQRRFWRILRMPIGQFFTCIPQLKLPRRVMDYLRRHGGQVLLTAVSSFSN